MLELPRSADIMLRNDRGRTALCTAARQGDTALIKQLLKHGANIENADARQRTPLMHAAIGDHLAAVKQLYWKGARLDAVDEQACRAATHAAQRGHDRVLRFLLQAGSWDDLALRLARHKQPLKALQHRLLRLTVGTPRQHALAADLGVALAHGRASAARLLVEAGARFTVAQAREVLKTGVRYNNARIVHATLAALHGQAGAAALIDTELSRALEQGASVATVDLLLQQRFAVELAPDDGQAADSDESILPSAKTLVDSLRRHFMNEAGKARSEQDWRSTTAWLCRQRGLRCRVARTLLAELGAPWKLMPHLEPDWPTGLLHPAPLLYRVVCASLLARSHALHSLRDDLRSTLESYASGAHEREKLDWEIAGPLAAVAKAQAAVLIVLGKDDCERECGSRVMMLYFLLKRMRPFATHAVAGQLVSQAGLLPALALEVAHIWVELRDSAAATPSPREEELALAGALLERLYDGDFKALRRAPKPKLIAHLFRLQAGYLAQYCASVLEPQPGVTESGMHT
ncbi:MAG: ankyrin repeat domain-containing protein [Janthinobacterium lividum]